MATVVQAFKLQRKRRFGIAAIAIVIFAAAAAAGYVAYFRQAAPSGVTTVGAPVRVERGNVSATISATGALIGTRQTKLTMPVAGKLTELKVKLADAVKADDVLARIDPAPLEMKMGQAESSLRSAQANLAKLKAGPLAVDVAIAESGLRGAEARLGDIKAGSALADLIQAQSSVDSSAASVRIAQSALEKLRRGATAVDLAAAELTVLNAQGSVLKAEQALAAARVGATPEQLRDADLALQSARNSLYGSQISRDATCSRGADSSGCLSANATILNGEIGVTKASEALAVLQRGADPKVVATATGDLASAKEAQRSAQLKLELTKAGPTPDEIQQAQSSVETALASQRTTVAKLEALKLGAKPADLESANVAVLQAQQTLIAKKNPAIEQEVLLAEESVKQADLTLRQARIDLEGATIRAPFGGVVAAVAGNVGEQVSASTALITLIDPTQMRVDITVDEADISRVAAGQRAEITFDALQGGRFGGQILAVAPTASVTQGVANYAVQVSLDNRNRRIPIGITANVSLVTSEKNDVLLVPNRALRRQGRTQVIDVLVNGATETRQVTTGLANDQMTEVTAGVVEGDMVLIPATTAVAPRAPGIGIPGIGGGGGAPGVKPAGGR